MLETRGSQSSEFVGHTYESAHYHIRGNFNIYAHSCENIKADSEIVNTNVLSTMQITMFNCIFTLGSKAYYANKFLFKSRLVCKKSKFKLYWSIIRPIATYACEVRVLKEAIKNKLMVFERKVLRKIFGPAKERGGTGISKTNDELDELIRHNKSHKSTTIKLVWPFTSNAGRENGKKKYISGNRCQYDHKGDQRTDGKMT